MAGRVHRGSHDEGCHLCRGPQNPTQLVSVMACDAVIAPERGNCAYHLRRKANDVTDRGPPDHLIDQGSCGARRRE
jgi:hypothetical protein